ncbi:MAG: hypothetical protein ACPG8W_05605 [Candidatus Promineifilaceae bacterium]
MLSIIPKDKGMKLRHENQLTNDLPLSPEKFNFYLLKNPWEALVPLLCGGMPLLPLCGFFSVKESSRQSIGASQHENLRSYLNF